jgi:hypothetical protein
MGDVIAENEKGQLLRLANGVLIYKAVVQKQSTSPASAANSSSVTAVVQ